MLKKFKQWFEWNFGVGGDFSFKYIVIILVIILALGLLYFLVNGPDKEREKTLKMLKCTTLGTVYKVEPREMNSQGYTGNKIIVIGYTVYYNYKVNGIDYVSSDYIPYKGDNKKLLNDVKRNLGARCFNIKYSCFNPNMAMIASKNKQCSD